MNLYAGVFTGESLIRWREPKAFVRMSLSRGRWTGALIVFLVPALLLGVSAYSHHFNKRKIVAIILFAVFGVCGFFAVILGFGSVVCLKQDHIVTSDGRFSTRVLYEDIDSCNVCEREYKGDRFLVLKFIMKSQENLFTRKLTEIAVPKEIDLNKVLEILQSKGIRVAR